MAGPLNTPTLRRGTVFEPCPKHSHWFAVYSRYRRAETFVEGGPGDSPCGGGLCQMKPGTGSYSETSVAAHDVYTGSL